MKVLFAQAGGDADILIQEWLSRHSSPRRVTLVSSDRVLQRAARGCRSKYVGSDEFLRELHRRRAQGARSSSTHADSSPGPQFDDSKPAAHLSASQATYWLKVFGNAPAAVAVEEMKVAGPTPQSPTKPKPAASGSREALPLGQPQSRSSADKNASNETEYWLQVFGDFSAEAIDDSREQLRLADLERWLKEFQAGDNT